MSLRGQRGSWTIWVVLLAVLAGAAIGGALVALWVFRNVDARLLLANQPAGGALITLRLRLASPGVNLQPPEDFSP